MADIISNLLAQKTPHSYLKLGKYYLMGIHVSKDFKKAESYLKKAKSDPKAIYYLKILKGEKTGKYPEEIENTTGYYKIDLYNNKNNKPKYNEIARKYAEMKKKYALNISFTNAVSENKINKIIRYGADLYSYGIKKPEYESAFENKFGKSIPLNEKPEFYIQKYNETKETDAKLAKLFLFIAVSMNNEESIILYCSNRDFYSKDHYKNIISRISNRCAKALGILGDIQYETREYVQSFLSYSKAYENGIISVKENLFNFYRKYKSFKGIPSNLAMFMRFGEGDKSFETEFIYKTASKPGGFFDNNSSKRSFYYAICLEHGIGVEKNVSEAIKIYESLATTSADRFNSACFYLGYLYEFGIIVHQNISKASKYYSLYKKDTPDKLYRLEVCNKFLHLEKIDFSMNPNINDKVIEGAKGKTDTDSMLLLAKNLSDPFIMHPDYEHATKYLKKAQALDSDLLKYLECSGKTGKPKPEIVINDKFYHAMSLLETDINESGSEFEEIGEKERFDFYKSYLNPTIENSYPIHSPTEKDFITPLEQYEWARALHTAKRNKFESTSNDKFYHLREPSFFDTPLKNGYLPASYANHNALKYNMPYSNYNKDKIAIEFGEFKYGEDDRREFFKMSKDFKPYLINDDIGTQEYEMTGKAKALYDQAITNYKNKNYGEYARLIKESANQKSSFGNKNFSDRAVYLHGLHCFTGFYQPVDYKRALECFKKTSFGKINFDYKITLYFIKVCQYFVKDKPKKYLYMRHKMGRLYFNALTEKDPIHHLIFAKKCYKAYYLADLAIKSLEIALKGGIKEAIYYLYLFQRDGLGFYPNKENETKLLMDGVNMEEPNCLLEYGNIIKSTDKSKGLDYIRKARDQGIAIQNSLFDEYEKKKLKYFDSNETTDDIIKFVVDNISNPEVKQYVDILVELQPTLLDFSALEKIHQYYPKETEILAQRIVESIDDRKLIYDIGINFLSREFIEKSGILIRKQSKDLYFAYGVNFINGNEKLGYKQNISKGNFIIITNAMKCSDDILTVSKIYLNLSFKNLFMKYQRMYFNTFTIYINYLNCSLKDIYTAEYCIEGMKLISPDYAKDDILLALFCPISDSNFDSYYVEYLLGAWRVNFDMVLKGKIQDCSYDDFYYRNDEYTYIINKITNDKYKKPLLNFLHKGLDKYYELETIKAEVASAKRERAEADIRRAERDREERKAKWDEFKSDVKRGVGDILDPHSMTTETKTTTYLGVCSVEETREFHRGDRDAVGFKDKNTDYGYKTVNVKK